MKEIMVEISLKGHTNSNRKDEFSTGIMHSRFLSHSKRAKKPSMPFTSFTVPKGYIYTTIKRIKRFYILFILMH